MKTSAKYFSLAVRP